MDITVFDILPVKLETERVLCKHMLLVVFEMVHCNAEHPCGKGAFLFEGRKMGDDL